MTNFKKEIKETGQALLFVVVAMTIALAVGVSVSVRSLSSISRVSGTDTFSRVSAAAEGGAEQFVVKTIQELADLTGTCTGSYGDPPSPPAECLVTFPGTLDNADPINAQTILTVSTFNTTSDTSYDLVIRKDSLAEINMEGYDASSVQVCWSPIDANKPSDLYYVIYKTDGTLDTKGGVTTGDVPSPYETNGFDDDEGGNGTFTYCYTVDGYSTGNVKRLRIVSLGGDSSVGIMTTDLPTQGYKIVSRGELTENGNITATREVTVYRSLPYLPGVFDAGIYTLNALQ